MADKDARQTTADAAPDVKQKQVVIEIRWRQDGEPRREIYGPWLVDEDDAYVAQFTSFLKDWPRVTGAEADEVTLILVQDPAAWLREQQEGRG